MQNQDKVFIDKQAQDWLVKLETGGMAVGDEDRFVAWLEQDEAHGEAFAEAEASWQLMQQIDADKINDTSVEAIETTVKSAVESITKPAAKPKASLRPEPKKSWAQHLLPLAATVLLTVIGLFYGPDIYRASTADQYTFTGQRLQQTLEDGSVITLNTDSAVTFDFTENQRLIKVDSGEIYVDVAPDKERPFIVVAGDMQVTALGTEFIVRHTDKQPSVVVTEHSVKVEMRSDLAKNLVLDEGQKATLLEQRRNFAIADNVNTKQASAWLSGKYIFQESSLREVVDEVSRYYKGKIVIRDKSLERLTVSGVLDLDEPLTAMEILASMLDLNVSTLTPYLVIIEQG